MMPTGPIDYARMGADTLMRKWTPETLPPAPRFHYHQGVFLSGMDHLYQHTHEAKYRQYIQAYMDLYIDASGDIQHCDLGRFDDMQPGILLFDLYRETGDARYKRVMDCFAETAARWPTNAPGGFWHKEEHPNQMWLDGLYMIGPFLARYARDFDRPYLLDKAWRQMELMRAHITDPQTGLLYHAWDDSKVQPWADAVTGLSAEFWGRAIGWYAVAVQDILDFIPGEHPARTRFLEAGQVVCESLARYQGAEDGRWYQVVNRGDDPRNWHENSCSCLFAYAMHKGSRLGRLDARYAENAQRGYDGVVRSLRFDGDDLILSDICVGTNVGDYQFYLDRPTVENDLHGMGAFLLMCTEMAAD